MKLYLIRHGETDYNRDRIFQGHAEIPLNSAGIDQAARLARRLASEPIDRIYASDLRRTAMTAAILSAIGGAPIVYDAGFRERDPGALTHMPYEAGLGFFGDPAYVPPGGESLGAFDARIGAAFAELARKESGRAVAVVTHGMVCAAFLRTCARWQEEEDRRIRWRNTSLTLARHDGAWNIDVLCDVSHLDEEQPEPVSATGA